MNPPLVKPADLHRLNGRSVLVKSAQDHHRPPTAVRGTVEVEPPTREGAGPAVKLVLDLPDRFNTTAHQHIVTLDAAGIARLFHSEREGELEYTLESGIE